MVSISEAAGLSRRLVMSRSVQPAKTAGLDSLKMMMRLEGLL